MTGDELFDTLQRDYLDDQIRPTAWDPDSLLLFLNEGEREACRRAPLLVDWVTPTDAAGLPLCQVSLVADVADYAVSGKILRIKNEGNYLVSRPNPPLVVKTVQWLNEYDPDWRTAEGPPLFIVFERGKIKVVPIPQEAYTLMLTVVRLPLGDFGFGGISLTGASDISFNATAKTITTVGGNFIAAGFRPGRTATVTGTVSNNSSFSLLTVTRTVLTVSETPVNETNTSAVITADSIPEIGEEHHFGLLDWAAHLAYKKQDRENEDSGRSKRHEADFTARFGPRSSATAEAIRRVLPGPIRMRPKRFGF